MLADVDTDSSGTVDYSEFSRDEDGQNEAERHTGGDTASV
eukprot:CAMPEP_0194347544 /NCGR_PEP_ID=MMETSP0171-20130528/106051_1 /TAXON_ID=218684 /ORGANISM="Corethron pennatum, Strain L29A3" /LENGTH=39 /DNA_ID= /DNA_START= /DNA_END= /DNA_ORIENTATION=